MVLVTSLSLPIVTYLALVVVRTCLVVVPSGGGVGNMSLNMSGISNFLEGGGDLGIPSD